MLSANAQEKFYLEKNRETFTDWYDQILPIADVVDKRYPVKGMPVMKPYGFFMHDQIMKLVELEWTKQDIHKAQFPLLIPQIYLKKEESHLEGFKAEVFWARGGSLPGSKKEEEDQSEVEQDEFCALRPTSETAMYAMFKEWIRSHTDLPLKIHQTCAVYRYETKHTLPLIRAREIHWNEAHTVHVSQAEALENLENAWVSYLKIIQQDLCYTGLRLRRPIWDSFPGGEHTDVLDTIMPSGKVLQVVGAHYLGQKFAKVFDIQYTDDQMQKVYPHMTCYGVSTRLLAACLSLHGDEKGLILPTKLAFYQIVVMPILMKNKEGPVIEACQQWVTDLKAKFPMLRVYLDLSTKRPAEKFYFWEMKGVPIRIEIGPRDVQKGQICLVKRTGGQKQFIPKDAWDLVLAHLEEHDHLIREKAEQFHQSHLVTECQSLRDLKHHIENQGGFVRVPYHTSGPEGQAGDEMIHDLCGGEIRGFSPNEEPPTTGIKCLLTGKPATCYAYIAKSY